MHNYPPLTSIAHFDIISSLHDIINNYPERINFGHMKEHQDKGTNILDIYEQMSIVEDARAKVVL